MVQAASGCSQRRGRGGAEYGTRVNGSHCHHRPQMNKPMKLRFMKQKTENQQNLGGRHWRNEISSRIKVREYKDIEPIKVYKHIVTLTLVGVPWLRRPDSGSWAWAFLCLGPLRSGIVRK